MLHQTTQAATSSLAPGVMEDLSIGVEGMGDISGDPAAKIWSQAILASSCLSIHIFLFPIF